MRAYLGVLGKLRALVYRNLPKLKNFDLSLFCQAWFFGLFAYPPMKEKFTLAVWDAFFIDGIEALYRLSYCLIKRHEKELLTLEISKAAHFLKGGFLSDKRYREPYVIFQEMWNLPIREKYLVRDPRTL